MIRPLAPLPRTASRGRLLVVDDDRRVASATAQWLCDLGWHASAVGRVEEALPLVAREPLDACIVDGLLPDGGADRIAAALRRAAADTGLVLTLPAGADLPAVAADQIGPVRWCRPGLRRYIDQFDERLDPRGRTYYWLAGEVVNDLEAAGAGPREWPTDVAQVQAGGMALTPLNPELFWRGELPPLNALV